MRPRDDHPPRNGFTLVEIILSIMLLAVLASVAGLFLVTGVRGFVLSQQNAALAQKADLALGRMTKELTVEMEEVHSLTTGSGTVIGISFENASGTRRNLLLTGSGSRKTLMLNTGSTAPTAASDEILVDNVSAFGLDLDQADGSAWSTADDISELSLVGISLTLFVNDADTDTKTFTSAANPRNNLTLNGPYE